MFVTTGGTLKTQMLEISTFHVGDVLCGIDIKAVLEINKQTVITPVPQSPDWVRGVINLRGRIITIIDLGKMIGFSETPVSNDNRIIIVDSRDEPIGLLVERINDIVRTNASAIESVPANIERLQDRCFEGVLKTETTLVGIMNIDAVDTPVESAMAGRA